MGEVRSQLYIFVNTTKKQELVLVLELRDTLKMADVLELDNAEEFEVDDEGDRKFTPLITCIVE